MAVILNMLSFGIIMPVMPALLEDITGLGAAQSVVYGGWLSMTFAIANFFAMPILGGLSDRYGRRPVLLASIGMLGIDLLIMGLAPTLSVLFLGRFLGGLFSGTYSVANAYIADVTEPEDRGRAFGMMGAAFGIGFILGPVFGGLLGEGQCPPAFLCCRWRLPGSTSSMACSSCPKACARKTGANSISPAPIRLAAWCISPKCPRVAWFIMSPLACFRSRMPSIRSTWNFHGEIRYDWSEFEIGLSLAAVGVGSAVSQALLTGYLIKRFGPDARRPLWVGGANAIALLLFGRRERPVDGLCDHLCLCRWRRRDARPSTQSHRR